jgi:hypothetical protein
MPNQTIITMVLNSDADFPHFRIMEAQRNGKQKGIETSYCQAAGDIKIFISLKIWHIFRLPA